MSDTRTEVDQTGATATPKEREQTLDEYQQILTLRVNDPDDELDMAGAMAAISARAAEEAQAAADADKPKRDLFAASNGDAGYINVSTPNGGCINGSVAAFLDILPRTGKYWESLRRLCRGGKPESVEMTAKASGNTYTAYGIKLPSGDWLQVGRKWNGAVEKAVAELLAA